MRPPVDWTGVRAIHNRRDEAAAKALRASYKGPHGKVAPTPVFTFSADAEPDATGPGEPHQADRP